VATANLVLLALTYGVEARNPICPSGSECYANKCCLLTNGCTQPLYEAETVQSESGAFIRMTCNCNGNRTSPIGTCQPKLNEFNWGEWLAFEKDDEHWVYRFAATAVLCSFCACFLGFACRCCCRRHCIRKNKIESMQRLCVDSPQSVAVNTNFSAFVRSEGGHLVRGVTVWLGDSAYLSGGGGKVTMKAANKLGNHALWAEKTGWITSPREYVNVFR
jgi:hypothetical protein